MEKSINSKTGCKNKTKSNSKELIMPEAVVIYTRTDFSPKSKSAHVLRRSLVNTVKRNSKTSKVTDSIVPQVINSKTTTTNVRNASNDSVLLRQAVNSKILIKKTSNPCESNGSTLKLTSPAEKYRPSKTKSVCAIRRKSLAKNSTTDKNKEILPEVVNSKEITKVRFENDGITNFRNLMKAKSISGVKYVPVCPKVDSKTQAEINSVAVKYVPVCPKVDSKTQAEINSVAVKYASGRKSKIGTNVTCEKKKSMSLPTVDSKNEINGVYSEIETKRATYKPIISKSVETLPSKHLLKWNEWPPSKAANKSFEPAPEYSEEFMSGALAEQIRDYFFADKLDWNCVGRKLNMEGERAQEILNLQLQIMQDERDELVSDAPYRFKCQRASLVRDVFRLRGWIEEPISGDSWDIHWSELKWLCKYFGDPIIPLKAHQKILHYRNCIEMTRKNLLVKNLRSLRHRIRVVIGDEDAQELDFMPKTYLLPSEHYVFMKTLKKETGSHWIIKPSGGSQGKDIVIINSEEAYNAWREEFDDKYKRYLKRKAIKNKVLERSLMPSIASIVAVQIFEDLFDKVTIPKIPRRKRYRGILPGERFVIQRYIEIPLLLCGRKFDIRFYVLVTSILPLKVYMYREGFCRMSLGIYTLDDIESEYTHLTNIAVQKKAQVYDEKLAKWPIEQFMLWIEAKFGHKEKVKLKNGIDTIVVRTLQSVEVMIYEDHHCFDCYGFDVIFDNDLKPWLLEVNAAPSLIPSNEDDFRLKMRLVDDTITVLNVDKRLNGCERRVGGYDLFWDSGPVYAEVDEDQLRDTSEGKMPRLNTHLGTSNSDRVDHLVKTFDENRELRKLLIDFWSDKDSVQAKKELDIFYLSQGYKLPDTFKNMYAKKAYESETDD